MHCRSNGQDVHVSREENVTELLSGKFIARFVVPDDIFNDLDGIH